MKILPRFQQKLVCKSSSSNVFTNLLIKSTSKQVPWLYRKFHFAEKVMTINVRFNPFDKILSLTLLSSWMKRKKKEIISELCKGAAGKLMRNSGRAVESEKRGLPFRRVAIWKSIHQASETLSGFGENRAQTLCVNEEMRMRHVCVGGEKSSPPLLLPERC